MRRGFDAAVGGGLGARGFWFELIGVVKAESAAFPETKGLSPNRAPLGTFTDNLAHSLHTQGISTYKNGYRPDNPTSFQYAPPVLPPSSCTGMGGWWVACARTRACLCGKGGCGDRRKFSGEV